MSALVMSWLIISLKWLAANPSYAIMGAGAVASMLESQLSKWPWAVKFARVLGHLGVNVAGLKSELLPRVPAVVNAVEKAVEAKAAGK